MVTEIEPTRSNSERRRWSRLPISLPFFIRGPDSPERGFQELSTALNISFGGALLVTKRYINVGTQITLEAPVSLAHKARLPHAVSFLQATVVRAVRTPQHFMVGVQFAEPLTP